MQVNCLACGAPVTGDAKFCSHCGARLPDNAQKIEIKSEIKIEDSAKLEEVRLKYALEEKERQAKKESKRIGSRSLKIKLWISWIVCIASLSIGTAIYYPAPTRDSPWFMPIMILFFASGIYALIITISWIFRKIKRDK